MATKKQFSPERLRYNVLSETLSDDQFHGLRDSLVEHRFRANDVILSDDVEGEDLFLIAEGRVKIMRKTRSGEEYLLALLHAADFFGELELVDGRPRYSRVIAVEDCVVYSIRKELFTRLVKDNSAFAYRLLQVLSVRLRTMNNYFVREMEHRSQQTQLELAKQQRLIEAAKNLNSTLDLGKLLAVILENALGIVDGDRGTVYLVDEPKQVLWSRVLKGNEDFEIRLPMGKGIAGYVAATGDTLNIPDAYFDPRFNPEVDKVSGYRTQSILCMPMRNKEGKIIGVFQLLNKHQGAFTEDDEHFLDALSVHAAIAVENARLYEQERQKIAMEKDLLAAREVQMSLIPKRLPGVPGYDLAACTLPAREVGGDLYDFIRIDQHRLAIWLGDVSGKGLPASLLMASFQATLRDQALSSASAAECIRRSNALLFQNTSSDRFVTLFYGVLDTQHHALCYCNGGHESPALFGKTGQARYLDTGGTVLGILEEFPFEEETIPLGGGSLLVITSDGISEAMNPAGEQFGRKRLESLIRENSQESAERIRDRIIEAVRHHVGNAPQMDDMTIVVVKRP